MEIKKINLTRENLIKIEEIDNTFDTNAITGIEWYLERYNESHVGYVLVDNSKYVGYLIAVPIKKELFDAIINGVITNDLYVNPGMFVNKSDYYYIYSTVILDNYKDKGYVSKLMKKLFEENKAKYCAITISKDGYKLANKYMDLVMNINKKVSIFYKNNCDA